MPNETDLFSVIDTETSSLFDFSKPADAEGQPRLAALTMLMLSPTLEIEREYSVLIKPDGWALDAEAAAVNGLTMDRLKAEGIPVVDALVEYTSAVRSGRVIAAYHSQYDCKVMRAELRRAGMDDLFMLTRNTCLMRGSHSAGVPKLDGRGGFPKLSDALAHIGVENSGAHTSSGDAHGALAVLRWLVRQDLLIPPGVHLAKKKPGEGEAPAPRRAKAAKAGPASADEEIPA